MNIHFSAFSCRQKNNKVPDRTVPKHAAPLLKVEPILPLLQIVRLLEELKETSRIYPSLSLGEKTVFSRRPMTATGDCPLAPRRANSIDQKALMSYSAWDKTKEEEVAPSKVELLSSNSFKERRSRREISEGRSFKSRWGSPSREVKGRAIKSRSPVVGKFSSGASGRSGTLSCRSGGRGDKISSESDSAQGSPKTTVLERPFDRGRAQSLPPSFQVFLPSPSSRGFGACKEGNAKVDKKSVGAGKRGGWWARGIEKRWNSTSKVDVPVLGGRGLGIGDRERGMLEKELLGASHE